MFAPTGQRSGKQRVSAATNDIETARWDEGRNDTVQEGTDVSGSHGVGETDESQRRAPVSAKCPASPHWQTSFVANLI